MVTDQYDAIGERYEAVKTLPLLRHVEQPLVGRLLGDLDGRSVVDLGCGTGFYARRAARRGAHRVVGIDRSAEMIRAARAREREHPAGVEYRVGDQVDDHGLRRADVALAIYVFNYAREQSELDVMVARAAAALRAGGELRAVIANPALVLDDPGFAKYGMTFGRAAAEPAEFTPVAVRGDTDPPVEFVAHLVTGDGLSLALARAGLRELGWDAGTVDQDGLDAFGREFWRDAERNVPWVSVRACAPA